MASVSEVAEQQRAYWNGPASEPWIRHQEERDASLAPIGQLAMAKLPLVPGARVLDIGCGCGTTSMALADRVGKDGAVLGVDLSEPMLASAEVRRQAAGLAQLAFRAGDAASDAFPGGPYDAVFSRFGVMFFADPVAAFRNIREAMAADGALAFVCWRVLADNPWVLLARDVVLRHVPPLEPTAPDAPGQFAFADPDRVHFVLSEAGFSDIGMEPQDLPFVVSPSLDLDEVVATVMTRGPSVRLLADAAEATLAKVRADLGPVLQPHMTDRGLVLGGAVWVVSARND